MWKEEGDVKRKQRRMEPLHFPSVHIADVNNRAGKHHRIVSDVLSDLARLDEFSALKIDFAEVGKKKADLRAALHRGGQEEESGIGHCLWRQIPVRVSPSPKLYIGSKGL